MNQNLQKIIDLHGGSQTKLASTLREICKEPVAQAHVWKWLNSTKKGVPGEFVIAACSTVEFKVTPHELRPDLYPMPEDGLPEAMRCKCSEAA